MRNIVLIILTLIQLIVFMISLIYMMKIDFLSLRIIVVALTTVLAIFFILLHESKLQLYVAWIALMLALIHVGWLVQTIYSVIY
ncbi:hypothetical protein BUZ56_02460 [Staphylococcus hyicus]|uniref:Uncharacterized protein n=2 Tax=Staphylococcus hyicus TaxID=1284 RepID=A0ACD5FP46_STAHY|nr:hypothetical protein [Staphylococcus hyicus]AJC95422.1 hypothetical protein SHYC_03090 [Staphylococcus hyicus]MCE5153974.1 hypothetical protein [Staphylococcus hyicus]MCQ9291428.1 hypothetical protein [Staphylococcus hyicus]MCQ9300325.1 hypothetical protein [Staphylococcus hyicus]MCQ9306669.1 hypothetical protein [Staphylococcus hyicus]